MLATLGLPVREGVVPWVAARPRGVGVREPRFPPTREMVVGWRRHRRRHGRGLVSLGRIGHLAEDPATLEERFVATNSGRMESFSFVAPVAYLLELLVYWTDTSRVLTFGIAAVLGMIVGSAAMAIATKTFRWEGFGTTEDSAITSWAAS